MKTDIAYTNLGWLITKMYDIVLYLLFDLPWWWWVILLVISSALYVWGKQYFDEITYCINLKGDLAYMDIPKPGTNPVVGCCLQYVSGIVMFIFCIDSAIIAFRIVVNIIAWLFGPAQVAIQ